MADVDKLLVVGSGGREFTILQEALRTGVSKVYSTRGANAVNMGIEDVINTGLGEKNIAAIGSFASQEEIDLVIVGPEAPLIRGIGDVLRSRGVPVFGPNADGAKFEANKVETHEFAIRNGLPNPRYSATFTPDERNAAKDHIRSLGPGNIYTKRVGEEGGKGAKGYAEDELQAALDEVDAVANKGESLVTQGRLLGPEYSAKFMLDGKGNAVAMALSRDHKSLYNGGLGPNTGGMGAFAPLSLEQASMRRRKEIEGIGMLIADGLLREGIDYRGAIYAGLMAETLDPESALYLLELNVRFGDPEMQVIVPKLGGRLIEYAYAAARGSVESDMSRLYMNTSEGVSLTVCLASPGYAQDNVDLVTGLTIHVPENLPDDVSLQFAGAVMLDGVLKTSGGRVVYATKSASSLEKARTVYDYIGRDNNGLYIGDDEQLIRTDIGLQADKAA